MEAPPFPSTEIAEKALPKPLYEAIQFIFNQNLSGVALVGGTALAGFYAGHRRSDDIELFTESPVAHRSAVLAAKSLKSQGAILRHESSSEQYYHVVCSWKNHSFTIDIVLDENLFRIGEFVTLPNKICVADLNTLLATKIATLVSRCAEKDLYDLKWLLSVFLDLDIKRVLELGRSVDGGLNAENILSVLLGTKLREQACGFSLDPKFSSKLILQEIKKFREGLSQLLIQHLKQEPTPRLGKLVRCLKKDLK